MIFNIYNTIMIITLYEEAYNMPYIDVTTNVSLEKAEIEALKSDLGEAISLIPGKSESWLMVNVTESSNLFFKGSDAPCAMFDVSIFGSADSSAYDALTKRICSISGERLNVSPDRTYVKYSEYSRWGWNNMNF